MHDRDYKKANTQKPTTTRRLLSLVCGGLFFSPLTASSLTIMQLYNINNPELIHASIDKIDRDEPDADTVKELIRRAQELQAEGDFQSATFIWKKVLANLEQALGPEHPHVATGLDNLAFALFQQGEYATVERLELRAISILEKHLGPDHPRVANSLRALAMAMRAQGQYAAAEPLVRRSLAISEKALGPDHPDFAFSLNNLAELLRDQGQYNEAVSLVRRSQAIYEKALGPDHPHVSTGLNNLASLLRDQGQYAEAEPLFRRSLTISEKVLGPDHPDVALTLNNLASLLRDQGQYSAAELLYRRSQAIYEKALGPGHPDVALSLDNLAMLLQMQGHHSSAERLQRRSLTIREKALGPGHPEVAISLNNLASILEDQGQTAKAETLYRRSLNILEKELGSDHPRVATSLNNLALLLLNEGQYAAAEPLLRRSQTIDEKNLSADHPKVALSLNNLAALLQDKGQNTAAEALYRRSLSILEKGLESDHPYIAATVHNLAWLKEDEEQYSEAESQYRRSLGIREKTLGSDHPDVARSLERLAGILYVQKKYSDVIPILRRSRAIETFWLLRELPLLPDNARSAQLHQFGGTWLVTFSWIKDYPPVAKVALETRLNRQGLLPEIEKRQSLLMNTPGVDREKIDQLKALTQQLASVTLPFDRRAEVRNQRDLLQAEIYRQIPELELQVVTTETVAKALPADGVLVEFQRYQSFDGRKPKDQRWGEAQYIALVLKPDASVVSVPLGTAAAIDSTVHQGIRTTAGGLSDADAIWTKLSAQVLKPLLPHLVGSRQWFLSPDGELNRVPFAALPAPQLPGTSLARAVQLRLLTTGRELVKLQQSTPNGNASLVMANPSYDRLGAKSGQAPKAAEVTTMAQQRSAELGSNQWKQLPASEREGQTVAKLLSTGLISGTSATTKALQRHQGPRVLHVATHGFFVADQETKPTEAMRAIQEGSSLLRSLRQEDPQLRSGLVFAGANQPELDPHDDGYLTAAEAVNLNLKGTELVVLSACSTGQGEVRTGEGVYGLQRSLTVAGARSTLLSLWKVDDAATAEFMARFYQRLKAGEGRSDALAAVQEEFRSGKVQSANGVNWKEPYYWAAWQLVGDWRAIPDL